MSNDIARIYASICRGILLQAAIKAGGQFINWSQQTIGYQSAYNKWLDTGRCQGFSIKFLHSCKNNLSFEKEVTASRLQTESVHDRNELHSELLLASLAGNTEYNVHLHERNVFMYSNYGLNFLESKKFDHGLLAKTHYRLAAFCEQKNTSTLISTKTHVMAVATYSGLYKFFEPNAGIVIMHSNKLSCLLSLYFEHPFIKKIYAGSKSIDFKASRYR